MQAKQLSHAVDVVRVQFHFLFCALAWLQHFLEVGMSYLEFGTVLVSVYCVNRAPAACPRLAHAIHRPTTPLTFGSKFALISSKVVHQIYQGKAALCAVLLNNNELYILKGNTAVVLGRSTATTTTKKFSYSIILKTMNEPLCTVLNPPTHFLVAHNSRSPPYFLPPYLVQPGAVHVAARCR